MSVDFDYYLALRAAREFDTMKRQGCLQKQLAAGRVAESSQLRKSRDSDVMGAKTPAFLHWLIKKIHRLAFRKNRSLPR